MRNLQGFIRGLIGCCMVAALSNCSAGGGGSMLATGTPAATTADLCSAPTQVGHAMCHVILRTDVGTSTVAFQRETESLRSVEVLPPGFGPAELAQAYGFNSGGGFGQTIALVDAYDDPNIESDLGVYRSHYNLSPCTTANGCFKKIAADGSTNYPVANSTWAAEITVDVEISSAVCPNCKILLVEAPTDSIADLGFAVDQAVTQGATVVSNSFGTPEWSGEGSWESHWNHPGVVITASTGDLGYGVEFPAASRYVVAVGGTNLAHSTNMRGYAETAWSSTGSGCSAYIPKPAWQHDTGCSNRTVADVSFDASPNSPVAIYHSLCAGSVCGWTEFGGTSVAAPAIAAIYALAGNGSSQHGAQNLYTAPSGSLVDVTSGNDGSCSVSYLCNALTGYDGPTGVGTPNGTQAF